MIEEFRQNGLGAVTGRQGVGKSYHSAHMLTCYSMDNVNTQKTGGRALIYDVTNDPAYQKFPILKWKDIPNQPPRSTYRLLAKLPNGKPFLAEEKIARYHYMIEKAKERLLYFEDWNTYALTTKNSDVMGPLTTARHNGCDIIFAMQNMSRITREIWENLTWYRFHKQNTPVDAQKNDIADFELLKIAEILVNDEFKKATQLRNAGKLNELEFKKRASYHLWVDFKRSVIEGCKREKFIEAAIKMIQSDKYKFWHFCNLQGLDHKKPDENREAVRLMLMDYIPYFSEVKR